MPSPITATAITCDDWPIFTRVEMFASTASVRSNTALIRFGFFSTRISSRFTPGSVVAAPTGTTAPFSAMSGPVIVTSLLSTGVEMPSALTSSAIDLASKAAPFQAAWAVEGSRPRPPIRVATAALRCRIWRRVCI